MLGVGRTLGTASSWLTTLILARLLVPEDFGLVAMATVVMGFWAAFSDLGLTAALIQRKDLDDAHRDAAFWSSLAMGGVLFVVSVALSPVLAILYREPRVTLVVILSAVSLLLGPFAATHTSLLKRELKFGPVARIEAFRSISNGVSAIIAASFGLGYWSIVVGTLVGNAVVIPAYYIANPSWRPRLRGTREHARQLFSFSLYVASSNTINYLSANLDYVIVGRVLGPFALGVYMLAYQVVTFPLTRISSLFNQVLFPALSSIQDDLEEVRRAYLGTTRSLAMITFPLLGWGAVVAPEFVGIVYGDKWLPAVPILQWLAVAGALKSIGTLVGSVFKSRGRPQVELYWNIVWTIAVGGGVLVGVQWGVVGVAAAISILSVPGVLYTKWLACRYIEMPFTRLLRAVWLPTVAAFAATGAGLSARIPFEQVMSGGAGSEVLVLLSLTLTTFGSYMLVLRVLNPNIWHEMREFFAHFRKAR